MGDGAGPGLGHEEGRLPGAQEAAGRVIQGAARWGQARPTLVLVAVSCSDGPGAD